MPPRGKGRPFYSHLYHGHRANLLLNRDSHPEIQEGKRERHKVSDCCSCCCAPGQTESACQCFGYCCCGSEQATAPFDHRGCPKAAGEKQFMLYRTQTHKQCQPVPLISEGLKKNSMAFLKEQEDLTPENNVVYNGYNIH